MRMLALTAMILPFLGTACHREKAGGAPAEVRVAAAADLKDAMEELLAGFHQAHPEFKVSVSYGSSGNFHSQIANGAPLDLFLSADISYVRSLVAGGNALGESIFRYAEGRLVLWVPESSPLEPDGLAVLLDPRVHKVAIANPEHAPYGRAAVEAMRRAGVYDAVKEKLVLGENVAQAASFVETGNADVGVIALSLVLAPVMKGRFWQIPEDQFSKLDQAGVIPARAPNRKGAEKLREWIVSRQGREILARCGFNPPPEP